MLDTRLEFLAESSSAFSLSPGRQLLREWELLGGFTGLLFRKWSKGPAPEVLWLHLASNGPSPPLTCR